MTIRTFAEDDRQALREIFLASRRRAFHWRSVESFSLDDFDCTTEGEDIWVATRGEEIVGFVSATQPDFIHHLYVAPHLLGRGYGTALLDECLDHLERPAALKCLARNTSAARFYHARGWKTVLEAEGSDGWYLLMHFDL